MVIFSILKQPIDVRYLEKISLERLWNSKVDATSSVWEREPGMSKNCVVLIRASFPKSKRTEETPYDIFEATGQCNYIWNDLGSLTNRSNRSLPSGSSCSSAKASIKASPLPASAILSTSSVNIGQQKRESSGHKWTVQVAARAQRLAKRASLLLLKSDRRTLLLALLSDFFFFFWDFGFCMISSTVTWKRENQGKLIRNENIYVHYPQHLHHPVHSLECTPNHPPDPHPRSCLRLWVRLRLRCQTSLSSYGAQPWLERVIDRCGNRTLGLLFSGRTSPKNSFSAALSL